MVGRVQYYFTSRVVLESKTLNSSALLSQAPSDV
jgi:hypothetical protein